MANRYTAAERAEIQRQAIDLAAQGVPLETIAAQLHISVSTASKYRGMVLAVAFEDDYKQYVRSRIEQYAAKGFDTLESQLRTLGDREYHDKHGPECFALGQAHRLVGEQIGRFLAAVYP